MSNFDGIKIPKRNLRIILSNLILRIKPDGVSSLLFVSYQFHWKLEMTDTEGEMTVRFNSPGDFLKKHHIAYMLLT
jgi:hypothetical protein